MAHPWKEVLDDGTEIIRTCAWSPPGCHPVGCGLRLFVKDGRLVKVEGDPDHPVTKGRLCVRCLALPEYIYHPDRIIYPMKRDPKDRGLDKWERISWDEAMDLAYTKLKETWDKYGQEGTVYLLGTGREAAQEHPTSGYAAMRTSNVCYPQSGFSCYGPRIGITMFVLGAGMPEIDYAAGFVDRYDNEEYVLPKYILVWGKEPLKSNPDGLWGHAIIEMMKLGSKIITIDPRMTWLATRAEYAVRLRPGTDAALGLGLLNVIINEDLYDHEFVDKWTIGFEDLRERVQEYPPSKVAEICEVPESIIVSVARALATERPNTCTWGLSVDQNWNGLQVGQVILALSAVTGTLDCPGGTIIGAPQGGIMASKIDASLPPGQDEKRIGFFEYPAHEVAMRHAHADLMLKCLETDEPYPIRFAWIQSTNLLSCTSMEPERWLNALKRMDFTMCTDIFMTPTAMALADLFLPVAAFPEHDGIVKNHYGMHTAFIGAIVKAIEVGECKSNAEIGFELGRLTNPEVFNVPIEDYIQEQIPPLLGETFESLKVNGPRQTPDVYYKYEKGMLRPDGKPGFNTVSGRVELYCTAYENFGDDPLPYYKEPPFSPVSTPELFEQYPLILTTGQRKYTSFHSEHRQIPSLRAIDPDPIVQVHPADAKANGLDDGDWIYIENMYGKVKYRTRVTYETKRGTVAAEHAWWFPEEDGEAPNLFGTFRSNVNVLIPNDFNGPTGFGTNCKSTICKIYKAED